MKKYHKKVDSFILFLEKHGIKILLIPFLVIFIVNKIFIINENQFRNEILDEFFLNSLRNTLILQDGTLITLAAVFIGIYFTVFTLLSSLKIDSTFSILTESNFYRLIKYIRNAFIGSFLYLLYSLFSPLFTNEWISTFISIALLLYMLLSALRFGFIIYNIFTNDVKKYYKQIEEEKIKINNKDKLDKKLEIYLDRQQKIVDKEYSEDFSKKYFD